MADYDHKTVLIVGGGLAGLLSALLWGRAGYSVKLWGLSVIPIAPSRTVALLEKSVAWLDRVGVWQKIAHQAQTLDHMKIIEGSAHLHASFVAEDLGKPRWAEHIALQHLKEGVLSTLATHPNIEIRADYIQEVKTCSTGVKVITNKGLETNGDIVIGADGRHSIVRQCGGIGLRNWHDAIGVMTGILTYNDSESVKNYVGCTLERYGEGELQTIVSLQGGRAALLWLGKPQTLEAWAKSDASSVRQHLHDKMHLDIFDSFVSDGVIELSTYAASALAKGSTLLVGEAAHGFPPIAAQGLNLSIRGIRTLEQGIQKGVALEDIGAWYHQHHYYEVLRTCGKVSILTNLVLPAPATLRGKMRSLAIKRLQKSSFLRSIAVQVFDGK